MISSTNSGGARTDSRMRSSTTAHAFEPISSVSSIPKNSVRILFTQMISRSWSIRSKPTSVWSTAVSRTIERTSSTRGKPMPSVGYRSVCESDPGIVVDPAVWRMQSLATTQWTTVSVLSLRSSAPCRI
jgi:hypothetical protein